MLRREAILALPAAAGLLRAQNAKALSNEELTKLLEKKDNLYFLDVREPKEIAELGSIPGYVNIPLGQLEARLREVPKNKLIVTA
jgi:rhodanese-related sulfurtransferase